MIFVGRKQAVDSRVDNPHAALQAALERPFPPTSSQDLSFHHQVLGA